MQVSASEFRWTETREQAALLVAQDQIPDKQIASQLGVNECTLERWKARPEFAARVEEHLSKFRQKIRAKGIAERQNRVDAYNDRWDRMRRVIAERAEDPELAEVAGGTTGMLAHTIKMIGTGRNATRVDEYQVDTGLLRELREHEKQAAQELGQWTEKSEVSGDVLVRQYVGVDPEQV